MRNPKLRLLFFMITIILSTALVCSRALADSAIYIYKNSNKIDNNYITALEDIGISVDTISYYSLGSINFEDYDLILVGNELFPNPDLIPVNDYPSLIVNSYHVNDWGWSDAISSLASNQPLWAEKASDNYITQGLPSQFPIYTDCCFNSVSVPVYYLSRFNKARSIETVVATTININDAVIGITESGDVLLGGKTAKARGCFFGIAESNVWTSYSETLFQRCAVYSAYGFDRDGDGYREDVDCNDTNPNIYPGATEVCNGVDDDCDKEIDEGGNLLCDDGLYCNGNEYCGGLSGCQSGTPINCSWRDDQCNVGVCDENTDTCKKQPANEGIGCEDGLYCNVGETCQSGVCKGGGPRNCSYLDDQCNKGLCDEYANLCYAYPANEGLACDDGKFCVVNETCHYGICGGGRERDCSANNLPKIETCTNNPDNNPLTWDYAAGFTSTCNETMDICTQRNYFYTHTCDVMRCSAECDTSHLCVDKCVGEVRHYNGSCNMGCTCNYLTENCNQYDGWYNTSITQWVNTGQCKEKEQKKQEYKDYRCSPTEGCKNNTITQTRWVDTGNIQNKPDGTVCDDSLFCNEGETCQSGICTGGTTRDCSYLDDQCHIGVCNEDTDSCEKQAANEGLACDDGIYCTINDACSSGVCDGQARNCSDGVSCTVDMCDEDTNVCVNTEQDSSCDDGLYCNGAETCDAVLDCQPGTPIDCSGLDDQCNVGVCNDDTDTCEAQPTNEGSVCDDGLYCTINDVCMTGVCEGSTRDCSDGVSCTNDSCSEGLDVCKHTPNNAYCDDGLFCNGMETCDALLNCQAGTPVDCSSHDLPEIATCTNDPDNNSLTWDHASGFISTCDEANDLCKEGSYAYTHTCDIVMCGAGCEKNEDCANYCSLDGSTRYYNSPGCTGCLCNYETENCNIYDGWYYTGNLQWVDIDECNEKEQREKQYRDYSCSPAQCVYVITDTQWEGTGNTRMKPYGTSCDDAQFCTVGEICQSGVCSGGNAYDCSFLNNQCNVGVCNEAKDQCEQDPTQKEGMACNDGLFCTVNDACSSGVCEGITPRNCSDSVSCTDDSCDDVMDKCVNTPNNIYCDDSQFCNGAEYCHITLGCQAGTPVDCSANNLPEIATCKNNPDNNPLTWDSAAGFTSSCYEGTDTCTTSAYSYTHTCSYDACGAECDLTHSCADTDCDVLDGCYSGTYRDYDDFPNTCNADCTCTDNACVGYTVIITDNDGDGFDVECDGECNDNDPTIYPGATEIMDNIDQNCLNDAPTHLSSIPDQEWLEDTTQNIDLSPYFDDVDGDPLSFVSTSPNNIDIEIIGSVATMTPDANWHGTRHVVFTAYDDGGMSQSSNSVKLTVTPVNDAPTVSTIPDQTWLEDNVKTLDLNAYFDDVDEDTLAYTSTTPANINVGINDGIVTFTPHTNWHGMSNIIFSADDGNGGMVSSNVVDLIVTTVNDAPVMDYIPDIEIMEGDFIKILPDAFDPDGDPITFTFTWPLNSNGEWQTDFNDAGIYMVTISALDGKGGIDSQSVRITVVEAGNHAPELDYLAPVSVTEGELVKIVPSAFDLDYDPLTFTFTPPLNSKGEWQTDYTDAGLYTTTVTVSDGFALDSQDVLITVLESGNHAPIVDVVDTVFVYEGEIVVVKPKVYDPDEDSVIVSYSAPLDSKGVWQTKRGDKGTYYAIVSASDGVTVTTVKVKIIVSEPPFSDIYISGIRIFNDKLKPGTNLEMSISFSDSGNVDMRGVSVSAYIPELGLYDGIGPFDLKKGKDVTKDLRIYIPRNTEKGEYTLKIIISNDDVRREKHRTISIV